MAKATKGRDAQFTYDFGIAIAQSTLDKITRLTGVTLTLASAYYALRSTAKEYIATVRENTLHFGGVLSTMKAMEQAQNRLIKGQVAFSVDEQLRSMRELQNVGVKVGDNLEWISKAAAATGRSLSQFSGAIASAISGNMGQLVEMGLLTQRATRMFDKYAANTVMRQQAILNFVKQHKGLQSAIQNSFGTIEAQLMRIKELWKAFLQQVVGNPKDPMGLYSQVRASIKNVADALAKQLENIRKVGWMVGQVLGYLMKQISHFVVWVGKQVKEAMTYIWNVTSSVYRWITGATEQSTLSVRKVLDNHVEFTRSLLVWMEFWKLKVIDFFKEYSGAIKTALKLLLLYKALKWVFLIGTPIIASVMKFAKAIKHCYDLQMRYMVMQGPYLNVVAVWFQSLAAWLPQPFRHAWVAIGKYLSRITLSCSTFCTGVAGIFDALYLALVAPFKSAALVIPGLLRTIWGGVGTLASGSGFLLAKLFGSRQQIVHFGRLYQSFFGTLRHGLKGIGSGVLALIKPIGLLFKSLVTMSWGACKAIGTAIMSIPLAGWIIAGITLLVILYKKFSSVRVIVNGTIKFITNNLKLIWNLTAIVITLLMSGVKKIWEGFKWLWRNMKSFFSAIIGYVKEFWRWFKDSTVGRWIDRWIVSPLKSLFNWIVDAVKWVWNKLAAVGSFLASLVGKTAEWNKLLAQANGVMEIPTFGSANMDADSTDYLSVDAWRNNNSAATTTENPLVNNTEPAAPAPAAPTTSINLSTGAIQVIVHHGENLDEREIARLVRDEILNLSREQNMRGGI